MTIQERIMQAKAQIAALVPSKPKSDTSHRNGKIVIVTPAFKAPTIKDTVNNIGDNFLVIKNRFGFSIFDRKSERFMQGNFPTLGAAKIYIDNNLDVKNIESQISILKAILSK